MRRKNATMRQKPLLSPNAAINSCLILSISVLASCANIPKQNAAPILDSNPQIGLSSPQQNNISWPSAKWWQAYNDGQLNSLIEQALESAPGIEASKARIDQALAYSSGIIATNGISANADAGANLQKQTYNGPFPKAFAPQGINDFGQITLSARQEIDLWGQKKARATFTLNQIDAARASAQYINGLVAASIVSEYAKLQLLFQKLETIERQIAISRQTSALILARLNNGMETKARYDLALAEQKGLEFQKSQIIEKIQLQKSAIAALVGKGQQLALQIGKPSLSSMFRDGVPQNLNVELLGHRGDIMAAKFQAMAASQKIKIAISKYYPNLTIGGSIGLSSMGLGRLPEIDSLLGQFGPALSLPIFSQDALDANLALSEADYRLSIAEYNDAILKAFGEIDQILVSMAQLKPQIDALDAQIVQITDARDNLRLRQNGGVANRLDVISQEMNLINIQSGRTDLLNKRLQLEISLMKALGGGFDANGPIIKSGTEEVK